MAVVKSLVVCSLVVLCTFASLCVADKSSEPVDDAAAEEGTEKTVMFLFTERCFDTFFVRYDFLNADCLKSLLSKGLSLAIIAGSFLLKAPQIFNIVREKSGKGLSPSSLYFDVAGYMCQPIYSFRLGYPFLTYGETLVILVQNTIIVLLVWHYAKPGQEQSVAHKTFVLFALGAAAGTALNMPIEYIPLLPTASIVLLISSRFPQIVSNCRNKDTGVSSVITWILNAAGAVARVFTTLNQTGDWLNALGYIIGAACSVIILLQIMIYGNAKKED